MNKQEALEHLRAAKSAHVKWVQKAKLLISGVEVDENAIPVESTECAFGRWFYSDAQKLNALNNNPIEAMMQIEQLHFKLHDIYLNIFNIYFKKDKKGLFSILFGSKRKNLSESEKEHAKELYEKLEDISSQLIEEINRLERRLISIPDEKMQALI